MSSDDGFDLWLGRIGSDRPARHQLIASARRVGGSVKRASRAFTGERIGRGAGMGRVLPSSRRLAGARDRRVVVKGRIVKLAGKGVSRATAHLRYLQRAGTTREGERGTLYGADADRVDGKAFIERGTSDRHQFRFIVAPEDGAEYPDLKPVVWRLMTQMEADLGTKLDWVAVDHFNTGHPHSHILLRGVTDRGKDLIIAREYMSHGIRARATELVNLDLGPRSDAEIIRSQLREIEQERFTSIDRRLIAAMDEQRHVQPSHRMPQEQTLRAGRLQTLSRLGLASEVRKGVWALDPELEPTLRRMGERGDIIRTIDRALREHQVVRLAQDYVTFDPRAKDASSVTGRVIAKGLSDELADRRYAVVDGIDGRSHYVDLGIAHDAYDFSEGSIVRFKPAPIAVRTVDRTVAEIAAANGGRYNEDIHLRHDAQATQSVADAHVRRLEAIRRAGAGVEREPDGTWVIQSDHLDRAEAYERALAAKSPVIAETLSHRPLETLSTHNGETLLDRELTSPSPAPLGDGFGKNVRDAIALRRQWLIEEGLAEIDGGNTRYRREMLATLQRRELLRVADALRKDNGLAFAEHDRSIPIEGLYHRSVLVGDKRFAMIEKSREFTLVPWRPVLERAIGKPVSGIDRAGTISWTIGGRSRGLGIG